MLNFRKELAIIRPEVFYTPDEPKEYSELVENILKDILQYYKTLEPKETLKEREIEFFINNHDQIVLKIRDWHTVDYEYSNSFEFKSREDARKVLGFLYKRFENNSFPIPIENTVENGEAEEFSVIID